MKSSKYLLSILTCADNSHKVVQYTFHQPLHIT